MPKADSPQPDVAGQQRLLPSRIKKTRFVSDLQPNEAVTTYFLTQSKELRFRRSGEPYLALVLGDRTGQLEAKKWEDISDVADTFERDDFVKVSGVIQNYRDRPQMTIHRLRRADESEVDLADYLPHTAKDVEEMFQELRAHVEGLGTPHLKALLLSFLDDEEIAWRLKRAPAAKSLHHAFIGGLLEHIISLLRLAELAAQNYDFIDLDLLKAGVVLHDLGKLYELTYERSFGYSAEGQLLGHIVIVLRMLERRWAQTPDFPPKLRMLLEHMILSHHGRYEFGSPKLPMFPEALMLHYLDDLDSKLESMRAAAAAEGNTDEPWTRFNPSLERALLKKDRFLAVTEDSDPTPLPYAAPDEVKAAPAESGGSGERPPSKPREAQAPLGLFGERLHSALEGGAKDE